MNQKNNNSKIGDFVANIVLGSVVIFFLMILAGLSIKFWFWVF